MRSVSAWLCVCVCECRHRRNTLNKYQTIQQERTKMAAPPTTATAKMVPTTNVCLQTHSVLEQVKRQYEFRRNHNNFYFFRFALSLTGCTWVVVRVCICLIQNWNLKWKYGNLVKNERWWKVKCTWRRNQSNYQRHVAFVMVGRSFSSHFREFH